MELVSSRLDREVNIINDLTSLCGLKVSNFKTQVKIDAKESWAWKSLENVNIPVVEKTILENIFNE